jgi:hypothetical protein
VFLDFESRLKTKLSPSERSLWTTLQGSSIPSDAGVYTTVTTDPINGDIKTTIEPDLFSMSFYSFYAPDDEASLFQSSHRKEHIDREEWIVCGSRDATYLLWSVKTKKFATLYVHETKYQPTPIGVGLLEFCTNVYLDLTQCPFLEHISEKQGHYFFNETNRKSVLNYLHFNCGASDAQDYCAYAILLDLPAYKLEEVFYEHRHEINQKCTTDGEYPINLAANSGRIDALKLLVSFGADLSLGPTSPFIQAAENGDYQFLRAMVRLGYSPRNSKEKKCFEKRLTESARRYVLG